MRAGGREGKGQRYRKRGVEGGPVKMTRGSKNGGREGGWEPDASAQIYLSCQII